MKNVLFIALLKLLQIHGHGITVKDIRQAYRLRKLYKYKVAYNIGLLLFYSG